MKERTSSKHFRQEVSRNSASCTVSLRRLKPVVTMMLASGALLAPMAANGQTASESVALVQQQIDRGHPADALATIDRLAAAKPVPRGLDHLRGMAQYAQGNLTAAEKSFAAAVVSDAADTGSVQMRGVTLYRLGRPAEAIPLLETAAARAHLVNQRSLNQRSEGPADPQYVLALCYLDTRRYDDARRAFAVQYGFAPESAAAYLLGARMLLRREYVPVAEQSARKALELQPGLPLAHLLLGETALAGEHIEEAISQFEQEKSVNPLYGATYDRLGDAYIRHGDYAKAQQVLEEAVLLEPNFTGPFILLGKTLLKQNNPAGAATYLEHAGQMDPRNYMTHSLLSQAYRQMARPDDAKREQDTAQKLQTASEPKLSDTK